MLAVPSQRLSNSLHLVLPHSSPRQKLIVLKPNPVLFRKPAGFEEEVAVHEHGGVTETVDHQAQVYGWAHGKEAVGDGSRFGSRLALEQIVSRGDNVGPRAFRHPYHSLQLMRLRDIIIVHKQHILSPGMLRSRIPRRAQIPVGLPKHLPPSLLPPAPGQVLEEGQGFRVRAAIIDEDDFEAVRSQGLLLDGLDGLEEELGSVVVDNDNRGEGCVVGALPTWETQGLTMNRWSVCQVRQQLLPLPLILLHTHLRSSQQH